MSNEDLIEDAKDVQAYNTAYNSVDNDIRDSIYQLQLDIDKQLSQLEMRMKGINYDPTTKEHKKGKNSGLPDHVVNDLMVQMRLRVNTNTILSFIPDMSLIDQDSIDFGFGLRDILFKAACEDDSINRQVLEGMLAGMIDVFRKCCLRAYQGKTMKNMAPNLKILESNRVNPEQTKSEVKGF